MGKLLIPVFLLVTLSLALWVYNIEERVKVEPPKTLTVTNTPAGWKTYQNKNTGLSFNYPADMTVEDNGENSILLRETNMQEGSIGSTNFMYFSFVPDSNNIGTIIYNYNDSEFTQIYNIPGSESDAVSELTEMEEWYTYKRLEDKRIDETVFQTYENLKPWEFPEGTKETRYIADNFPFRYVFGAYHTTNSTINETLIEKILTTVKITKPEIMELSVQKVTIQTPSDWTTYEDPTYGLTIRHPEGFTVTPAPTEGNSGLIRLTGEANEEAIWIEIAALDTVTKGQDENLQDVEHRRSPETKYESEKLLRINTIEVFQQIIPLVSGGINAKSHGIYNLFELSGNLYFAELYTSNPESHVDFINQIISGIEATQK